MAGRRVGTSGLQVSRLGLGTMTWGTDVSPATARDLVLRFAEEGGNLVDTAPAYGNGMAEKVLGRLIHTDLRRDDLVIATKGGFGVHNGRRSVDTSRGALLDDLAGSLRRLHTDHVDLWQLHAWGDAPLEETLAALDHAVGTGMARYAGISNYVGWQTARAATWQQAVPGRAHVVSTQVEYSLVARRVELEVVPAAQALGMGVFPWAPLGRGVLAGRYRGGVPDDSRAASKHLRWFVEPYLEPKYRAVVDAVTMAATGLGLTPAQVALLWVRDAPAVTAPLLGVRTVEQLEHLLVTETKRLPDQIVSALDDVTGGPNLLRTPQA